MIWVYRRVPFVCAQLWYYGFLFSSISAKIWSFLHFSRVAVKRNSTFFENRQLWDTWDIMILIDLVTDLWLSSYSSSKSPILEPKLWFWQRSKFPTWKRGESFQFVWETCSALYYRHHFSIILYNNLSYRYDWEGSVDYSD